jgi:coenzyme F420-dependent glucose-6-phosphate dehydrogenase
VPSPTHVEVFEGSGGRGKRRIAQVHVCWANTRDEAVRTMYRWWPVAALKGSVVTELLHPKHFEQVLALARPDDVAGAVAALGPDPEVHLDAIASFAKAGFNEILVHQIGPGQDGFFHFYEREIFPSIADACLPTSDGAEGQR